MSKITKTKKEYSTINVPGTKKNVQLMSEEGREIILSYNTQLHLQKIKAIRDIDHFFFSLFEKIVNLDLVKIDCDNKIIPNILKINKLVNTTENKHGGAQRRRNRHNHDNRGILDSIIDFVRPFDNPTNRRILGLVSGATLLGFNPIKDFVLSIISDHFEAYASGPIGIVEVGIRSTIRIFSEGIVPSTRSFNRQTAEEINNAVFELTGNSIQLDESNYFEGFLTLLIVFIGLIAINRWNNRDARYENSLSGLERIRHHYSDTSR